jgi:hypothetical protein
MTIEEAITRLLKVAEAAEKAKFPETAKEYREAAETIRECCNKVKNDK